MSSDLKPKKNKNQRHRFSQSNFRNDKLQFHLDDAKGFSDNVQRHLLKARQSNHVLSSAAKSYQNFNLRKMTRSQSFITPFQISSQNNTGILLKNPQSQSLINAFDSKAQRMPQIERIFCQSMNQKQQLQDRISELKRKITNQKKLKDKISVNNYKMMNQMQRLKANIKRYSIQSRNDDILIRQALDDCLNLQTLLNQIIIDNKNCSEKVYQQYKIVEDYHNKVLQMKRLLSVRTNQMHRMKEAQTVAFKMMTNDYMKLNQRKEEKALLLSDIDLDYFKNS